MEYEIKNKDFVIFYASLPLWSFLWPIMFMKGDNSRKNVFFGWQTIINFISICVIMLVVSPFLFAAVTVYVIAVGRILNKTPDSDYHNVEEYLKMKRQLRIKLVHGVFRFEGKKKRKLIYHWFADYKRMKKWETTTRG